MHMNSATGVSARILILITACCHCRELEPLGLQELKASKPPFLKHLQLLLLLLDESDA